MAEVFNHFATSASRAAGNPATFAAAISIIILWAVSGPFFGFSDTWQLIINTSTTIVTFLMVFLIQNTQNRDNEAIQIKLDELIRAAKGAQNAVLDLEGMTVEDLDEIRGQYEDLAKEARHELKTGGVRAGQDDKGKQKE
ncbi:MAG TPA: low affinity iron permease family protein [Candidatus Binatia bacterium]|nr:low affinity iron permease family protein [Candidatus Binatia bacterium]